MRRLGGSCRRIVFTVLVPFQDLAERMREGEREAGKVPDFSCRSGKIDLEDEIGDKGISKGNGFSPLFFTSQES